MPVLMVVGAVAIIVTIMLVGWRQRWDPTPQPLAPVTLKSARAETSGPPLPWWVAPVAIAGIAAIPVSAVLGTVFGQRWLVWAGISLYGLSWGVRLAVEVWVHATSRLQRAVAVARPGIFLVSAVASVITRSMWWLASGGAVYIALAAIAWRDRRRPGESAQDERRTPPRSGDTPR